MLTTENPSSPTPRRSPSSRDAETLSAHHEALHRVVATLNASLGTLHRQRWIAGARGQAADALPSIIAALTECHDSLATLCVELAIERAKRTLGACRLGARSRDSFAHTLRRNAARLGDALVRVSALAERDDEYTRRLRVVARGLRRTPATIELLGQTIDDASPPRAASGVVH